MLESRESSSPYLTRSIYSVLAGKDVTLYEFSKIEKIALSCLGALPKVFSLKLIPRFQSLNAISKNRAGSILLHDLINERLSDYEGLRGKFKSIVFGVGLGGATGHLSSALNAPFLPQAFVLTVKGGSTTANINEYFNQGWEVTKSILSKNPGISAIQHFDPVHDGWLTRSVNHIRLKVTSLPEEYKQFIETYLEPYGTILYLEGNVPWLQYITSPRSVFQVGGWGGIADNEYIDGSERIQRFKKRFHLSVEKWSLNQFHLKNGYESEWGSEPDFGKQLENYCQEKGYKLQVITFSHPFQISKLAFHSMRTLFKNNEIDPVGTIIEMFSQYDLRSTLQAGLLPMWLVFNTEDSLRDLKSALERDLIDKSKPVYFSGLSTFSQTPDLSNYYDWENCLKEYKFINIGARKTHFPADPWALLNWNKSVHSFSQNREITLKKFLNVSDVVKIYNELLHGTRMLE